MIGVYGGTFDPVHLGHTGLARAALEYLPLRHVYFVPLGLAVHREQPVASPQQRLIMLEAAIEGQPQFSIDASELVRTDPSWTIQTLTEFQHRFSQEVLCLLLGSDAFCNIDTWRDWQSLLDWAHIVVVARKGDTGQPSPAVLDYLQKNRLSTRDLMGLGNIPGGRRGILWILADVPGVSSTLVRAKIQQAKGLEGLVLPSVARIIREEQLYGG